MQAVGDGPRAPNRMSHDPLTASSTRWKVHPDAQLRLRLDALARLVGIVSSCSSDSVLSEALEEVVLVLRPSQALAWRVEGDTLLLRAEHNRNDLWPDALRCLGSEDALMAPLQAAMRLRRTQPYTVHSARGMRELQPWLPFMVPDTQTVVVVPVVNGADVLALWVFFSELEGACQDESSAKFLGIATGLLSLGLAQRSEREHEEQRAAKLAETTRLAALGSLSATVAHELRGPAGALGLLIPEMHQALLAAVRLDPSRSEGVEGLLSDMRTCVERITSLCGQLGSLSHQDPEPQPFFLDELVAEVVAIGRVHAKLAGIEIKEHFGDVDAHGRRDQVGQVVMNLLLNAIDACRDVAGKHHRIDVTTSLLGNAAVIEVADTGPGIEKAAMKKIFTPFFTTKAHGKGTGLGLSISRDIVQAHRGHIEVEQSPRGGALFRVFFPAGERMSARWARAAEAPAEEVSNSAPPTFLPQQLRVLLMDDDTLLLRTMKRVLREQCVTLASSLEQARHALGKEPFDVIVSDIHMPGGGGTELHQWLSVSHKNMLSRIIFLTGGALSPEQAAYVRDTGCVCLSKPVTVEALIAGVHAVLGSEGPLPDTASLTLHRSIVPRD